MITSPRLPPREGYVEIETSEGEHIYQATPEQLAKEAQERLVANLQAENADLRASLDTLLGVTQEVTP